MGKLALAAKITHVPSMYLSELDGPRRGTRRDAIDGHVEIGRRCRELGVDTIVVFDTHWLVNANYHLNCAPHFKGLYTSNELPHFISNMPFEFPGNPDLGQLLAKVCNEHGVETLAHHATTLAPEYGTLVPMRYMNADQHFKVISVSALCTVHYLNDSARLGWAMRRAIEEHYDGTVAFFASGSLSHRFAQNGLAPEYAFKIWSPFLENLDRRVLEMWQARRVEGLLRDAARVREQRPRRRLHARHRHAAGRAGLVGLRRCGRDRDALLRRLGHRAAQCRVPGHAAGRARHPGCAGLAGRRLHQRGHAPLNTTRSPCPTSSSFTPATWMPKPT
jgi:3,4-dihydroxyphenylacetate 2,3-dioxygenase